MTRYQSSAELFEYLKKKRSNEYYHGNSVDGTIFET